MMAGMDVITVVATMEIVAARSIAGSGGLTLSR
jgi:hypothetical protein